MEQWKQINGAPDGYEISDLGRIKIIKSGSEIIKLGYLQGDGYRMVGIGFTKHFIHRLVADHFCDGPNDYECVNHLNGIKTDNRAVNLEKTTYKRNNQHAIDTELRPFKGVDHYNTFLTIEQIHEIYRLKKEGKRLYQIKGIFGLNYGTLKCIFNGKNWKYEYEKFFGEGYKKNGRSGNNQWAAIPESQVLRIYELKKAGKRIFEIAKELGLQFATAKNIYHGKNWKHLYKEHF
jgi:hypothetical protein